MLTSSNDGMERRERLLAALRAVEAVNGSPDIIRSIKEALQSLSGGSDKNDKFP